MQVQFYNVGQVPPRWIVANDTINETSPKIINIKDQYGLDNLFNDKVYTTDLINYTGYGLYRVYAALKDPYGNVLQCDNVDFIQATYEFNIN